MRDALLTSTDREEALSRAYVAAVAAGAGYVMAEQNFDRDGVDVQIRAGGSMRPSLDIQLKATINLGEATNDEFRYALKRRNYDLLRGPSAVPRILLVLSLPPEEADWLSVTAEELILRRCAFWASIAHLPETQNAESVTISIHKNNKFDIEALIYLMDQARTWRVA